MNRKPLFCILIFLHIVFTFSSSLSQTLKIFGRNRLAYWQWKENNENFFEDALNINAIYGNFKGKIEFYIYEPSYVNDPLRKEGLRKRSLEFRNKECSIKAGDFYHSFGRGLTLNQTNELTGNIDRDIDGFHFNYAAKFFAISLLSGRPRNLLFSSGKYTVVNDTSDVLQGGSLLLNLNPSFPFSINLLKLSSENPGTETPRETYLYGFNIDIVKDPFVIYGEFVKRDGWDDLLFTDSEGEGIYGSLTFFLSNISTTIQYFHYDSIGYGGSGFRYNSPPTGNLDEYSINRASDERGWSFDIISNPFGSWYFNLNKSMLSTLSSDSVSFDELYAEAKGEILERGPSTLLSLKTLEYRNPEPIIDKKTEWIPHLDITIAIGQHSLKLGLNSRIVEIDTIEFMDNAVSLDVGLFSYLTIAGRWEVRNKEVPLESEGTEWKVLELRWDISDSHTLNVIAGTEKGGLVCSGGVCRIEDPFDGIKIRLLSNF